MSSVPSKVRKCAVPPGNLRSEISFSRTYFKFDTVYRCFFKFFKRVTWWSFRVSTSFSLLCLILLTHFHKNASFRPNMLDYLNTTFTFDKQTKDNFINRTVQCIGLNTHSFARFRAGCFIGENRGGSSPRTRNTSRLTAISDSSACSTPRRTKQGRRCSHATWSLEKFWAAFQWV